MKPIYSISMTILLSAAIAQDAAAQFNVARFETKTNRVYTTFGLDPALVSSVGYGRVISPFGHDVQLSGEVGVVTARFDARDYRTRIGVQSSVLRWRSLYLNGSATFITRGTENAIYRGLNLGADLTGSVGIYRSQWFLNGEFGKDKAIITHVTHTDWYRTQHYADAKDGWYLDAGGTYHYGLAGGFALGAVEFVGRAGWQKTEDFKALMTPFYGSVGIGFAF